MRSHRPMTALGLTNDNHWCGKKPWSKMFCAIRRSAVPIGHGLSKATFLRSLILTIKFELLCEIRSSDSVTRGAASKSGHLLLPLILMPAIRLPPEDTDVQDSVLSFPFASLLCDFAIGNGTPLSLDVMSLLRSQGLFPDDKGSA